MKAARRIGALITTLVIGGCATAPPPPAPADTIDLVTPLPANFNVHAPAPQIPKPIAEFSGIWKGDWLVAASGEGPVGILHHTLVVTRIEPSTSSDFRAAVVYSAGAPPATWQDGGPGFWELWGTVSADGTLRMKAPGPDGGEAVYTVADDGKSLKGQYLVQGKTITGTFLRIR